MAETLKERCYNAQKAFDYYIDSNKWILVHIDGRCFSKKIKNKFEKPFDARFIDAMNATACYLCENIQGAKFSYVQSDEITLVLHKDRPESQIFFNGRMCKMQSIIASMATAKFNQFMMNLRLWNMDEPISWIAGIESVLDEQPLYEFDCKVWGVDTIDDVFAWLLFRSRDCIRNSKQQSAQTYLSHSELIGLSTDEQIGLLKEKKGIDWEDYSKRCRYGRYITKMEYECRTLIDSARLNEEEFIARCKDRLMIPIEETEHSADEYITVKRMAWTIVDAFDLTAKGSRAELAKLFTDLQEQ